MTLGRSGTWTVAALVLAFSLSGCNESSPLRFTNLRRNEVAEGPPTPAPALYIPKAPAVASDPPPARTDTSVKPATFLPKRDPEPLPVEQPLRALYQRAADANAKMDSYIFRLKRREVLAGSKQPEEIIRVEVRREPFSVHLVWLNDKAKGREVIYVRGKFDNKMQVLLSPDDDFVIFGRRKSLAIDDPLVRASSRHPITETGFGSAIENFGKLVAAVEKGDNRLGTAKYLGLVQRSEFEAKVHAVHQVLPKGSDPLLPKGGQRWWFFDAGNGLPALIITHDLNGEVEYYCNDYVQSPVRLDDTDFDPKRLWGK
jgi:hypothetical protein